MEKKKTKHVRFSQEDLKEKGFRETAVRRMAREETKSSGRKLIYDRWSGRVIQQRFGRKNQWKSVLDTPLLTDDGLLTDDSEKTSTNIEGFLNNLQIAY